MTKKERKARHRRGPGRSNAAKDSLNNKITEENDGDAATSQIQPKETFDSSKYDALRDMNIGSDGGSEDVKGFALGERATHSLKPERMNNEEITRTNASGATTVTTTSSSSSSSTFDQEVAIPKINPIMVEERARPIRETKECEKMGHYLTPFERASSSTTTSSSHLSEVEKNMKIKFVLYPNILLSVENAGGERLRSRILQSP